MFVQYFEYYAIILRGPFFVEMLYIANLIMLAIYQHFQLKASDIFNIFDSFSIMSKCNIFEHSLSTPVGNKHLSECECLKDKRENYQNCSVLCCVQQL